MKKLSDDVLDSIREDAVYQNNMYDGMIIDMSATSVISAFDELLAYRKAEKSPLGYSDIHSIKKLNAGVSFLIPVNQTLDSYFSVPVFSGPVLNKAQGVSADFVVIDEIEEQKGKSLIQSQPVPDDKNILGWCSSVHAKKLQENGEPLVVTAKKFDDGDVLVYASPVLGQTPALNDVIAERQRQISVEGRTLERDDNYKNGSMAVAAACYARLGGMWNENWQVPYTAIDTPSNWPWPNEWWKPTNPRRDLVKAAALILAEIERLDRAAIAKATGESE